MNNQSAIVGSTSPDSRLLYPPDKIPKIYMHLILPQIDGLKGTAEAEGYMKCISLLYPSCCGGGVLPK